MFWNECRSKLYFSLLRICRSPPPQKWCKFHDRCPQCWIECKFIFNFSDFYFSSYGRFCTKIHRILPILSTKMTISQKLKIAKKWKLIFSLVSALWTPFIKLTPRLRGKKGGGVWISLLGTGSPNFRFLRFLVLVSWLKAQRLQVKFIHFLIISFLWSNFALKSSKPSQRRNDDTLI